MEKIYAVLSLIYCMSVLLVFVISAAHFEVCVKLHVPEYVK